MKQLLKIALTMMLSLVAIGSQAATFTILSDRVVAYNNIYRGPFSNVYYFLRNPGNILETSNGQVFHSGFIAGHEFNTRRGAEWLHLDDGFIEKFGVSNIYNRLSQPSPIPGQYKIVGEISYGGDVIGFGGVLRGFGYQYMNLRFKVTGGNSSLEQLYVDIEHGQDNMVRLTLVNETTNATLVNLVVTGGVSQETQNSVFLQNGHTYRLTGFIIGRLNGIGDGGMLYGFTIPDTVVSP